MITKLAFSNYHLSYNIVDIFSNKFYSFSDMLTLIIIIHLVLNKFIKWWNHEIFWLWSSISVKFRISHEKLGHQIVFIKYWFFVSLSVIYFWILICTFLWALELMSLKCSIFWQFIKITISYKYYEGLKISYWIEQLYSNIKVSQTEEREINGMLFSLYMWNL